MIQYAVERYKDVIEEIKPLLILHWQELAAFPDIPLDPNYNFYEVANNRDLIRIYTARDDGKLVGYAIYIISLSNPHYMSMKTANSDIVFVHPDYRNGGVGYGLYEFIESQLPGFVISTNDKISHPELGRLMKARGYEAVTTAWVKRT